MREDKTVNDDGTFTEEALKKIKDVLGIPTED